MQREGKKESDRDILLNLKNIYMAAKLAIFLKILYNTIEQILSVKTPQISGKITH